MAERILELHLHGVVTELAHLSDADTVTIEEVGPRPASEPTTFGVITDGGDPATHISINVRSSALPVITEIHPVNEAADNTPEPVTTERVMEPRVVYDYSGLKVPELRALLEERGLDTKGKKAELLERLTGA